MRRLVPVVACRWAIAAGVAASLAAAPRAAPSCCPAGAPGSPSILVARRLQGTTSTTEGESALQAAASKNGTGEEDDTAEHLPSTDIRDEHDEDNDLNEEFDELEAASQEVHDLCFAMIGFLRRADPDVTKDLFERRSGKRFREPTPEQHRRLLHGHENRGNRRHNSFRSDKDLQEATKLYCQLSEKLLLLLTKPLLDRLLENGSKAHRDHRWDGVHSRKKYIEKASWRNFPHRWFRHAPFEVQQLRADIPESAVKNTRFFRDQSTLKYLFTLMEPQHPYRAQIEQRMFELTKTYDPAEAANNPLPVHK